MLICLVCLCLLGLALPAFASAALVNVNSLADTDDGNCDLAPDCTLREAVNAAGASDTITFSVAGTITLGSALPSLQASVDGSYAPGASVGDPGIEIDANGFAYGLDAQASASISTLSITGSSGPGIRINNSTTVLGCFLGVNLDGVTPDGNDHGVAVMGGASAVIGVAAGGGRNVISGNSTGVVVHAGAAAVTIRSNFIGTDEDGMQAVPNSYAGIEDNGTPTIGGSGALEGNVISGNGWHGIISHTGTPTIDGNIIGLAVDGETPLGNGNFGVVIDGLGGQIGASAGNVIASNVIGGVRLAAPADVTRNWIGTDASGLLNRGNGGYGIQIQGGPSNFVIGGSADGDGSKM